MKDGIRSPTQADKGLGSRIKRRRRMVGMSQTALGEKIGVSFRQVQKYESGINRVGVTRLEEIALALDVPVSHFLSGSQHVPPSGTDIEAFMALPESANLIAALVKISDPAIRRQIAELACSIAGALDRTRTDDSEFV